MTLTFSSSQTHSTPKRYAAQPLPQAYCTIPQRLLADLHDTPLAIGLYALVPRLYLIMHAPVPLKRAFDRLGDRGWLIAEPQTGHQKQRYTPTWGRIGAVPRAWRMDVPCLGRPRHIIRLMLDRGLLDICMGKLTPHATQAGTITRYVTTPVLSLADVGCYALTLADIPRETPNLRRLSLVRSGQALSLPAEPRLLALISQRALDLDEQPGPIDTALTNSGTRRLGVMPAPAAGDRAQPLFFVPPSLIGSLIGSQIGAAGEAQGAPTASQPTETPSIETPRGITWEASDLGGFCLNPQKGKKCWF